MEDRDKENKWEKLFGPLYDKDACNLNEYTIQVDIPKRLNDKQKEALKSFADIMGEEVQIKKKGFWNK